MSLHTNLALIALMKCLISWLQRGKNGYTFGTSKLTISSTAHANNLAAISNNLQSLQTQLEKLDKYYEWT